MDVTQEINAVRRTVGTRTLEAGEARTVTLSRRYDTTVDDLWDACTNAERIARWFLPVTGELRLGGRYQLDGNAGGTVESCDPPKSFSATWEFAGAISWIEVRLSPVGGGALFQLDHITHVDDHWERFGPGAVGVGWDGGLLGLSRYLATGSGMNPAEAAAWMGSDEGKQFMTLSSEAWCEAYIAAGGEERAARESAARTTAFYTGAAS